MKIYGREVQKAVVSEGAGFQASSRSALTSLKLCTNHRCKNAMVCLLGLSKKVCRRSPVCWYITDSRAFRSKAVALPNESRASLGINCARVSLAAQDFTVQQARAQLCNPSGGDCLMSPDSFMCRSFHQIAKSTSLVSWSCLIHRVLFVSFDVDPPTGRGHGRCPNVDCTFGAADSASLQVFP